MIEQAQQLKITATNIKSSLISGNKKLQKIRIAESNFLKKLAEDRQKRRKAAGLGKAFKPVKTLAKKVIAKPGGSLLSKIFEFFSLLLAGILIKALPQLLKAIKGFFDKISPFLKAAKNILGSVGESIGSFFEVFNKTSTPDIGKLDDDKSKIEKDIKKVNEELSKVDQQIKSYKNVGEGKQIEFERDFKKKEKESNSVELSNDTAKLVRREYDDAIEERNSEGNISNNSEVRGGKGPRKENNNIEGVVQNTSNLNTSTNLEVASNLNVNKSEQRQKFKKGGPVGSVSSSSGIDPFKGFEINSFDQRDNLKDQENNTQLLKNFGDGLLLASNMSSSSSSSKSNFSVANSKSELPIVGRVGNTGESTGPHVHIQRYRAPTSFKDAITKDHPVMKLILVGGKPLTDWTLTSPASPDRGGKPHYGPDFGGDGINNKPIQLTGGITWQSNTLYQESAGPEGNNILFEYNGEKFVIFHLNSGPEYKPAKGMGGMMKGIVPTKLQRGPIDRDMDEEYVYMLQQQLLTVIT